MFNRVVFSFFACLCTLGAMEFKDSSGALTFFSGGREITFKPSMYNGIKIGGVDFFLHFPMWTKDARSNDLRMDSKAISVRIVAENDVSRTVEAVYPLCTVNESKGIYAASPTRIYMIFKQYRDLPVVAVFVFLENCGNASFDAQPYLIGSNFPKNGSVTSVRWSPPPATVVTEKLAPTPQMQSHPHYFLKHEKGSFGLVGKCGKEYDGNAFRVFFPRQAIPTGKKINVMNLIFAESPASYEELVKFGDAVSVLNGIAFANGGSVSGFQAEKGPACEQSAVAFTDNGDDITCTMTAYDSTMDKRLMRYVAANDPVYNDDCLELSVMSDSAASGYCHFMVNPRGTAGTVVKDSRLDDSVRGKWRVSVKDAPEKWEAAFTFPKTLCDRNLLEKEKCIMFHANREAKYHNENSGLPSGKFHSPENFGRLLLTDYTSYLKTQIDICRELGGNISADPGSNSVFENALLDLKLQRYRKQLGFDRDMAAAEKLLSAPSGLSDDAKNELATILKRCEKPAISLDATAAYSRMKSRWMHFISGGKNYVFWKKPPFDYLGEKDIPASVGGFERPFEVEVAQEEYETVSVAATNLSNAPIELKTEVMENPDKIGVDFRYGYPMKSAGGLEVNDPLPRLVGDKLIIPPYSTRELWITLNTKNIAPGKHSLTVQSGEQKFKFDVLVHPVKLEAPADFASTFFTLFAGARMAESEKWVNAFKNDVASHHAETVTVSCFPFPKFDEKGNNVTDYSIIPATFRYVVRRDSNGKIIIYWSYTNDMQKYIEVFRKQLRAEWGTPEFETRFRIWISDWMRKIREYGYENAIYMYPVDEKTDDMAFRLIRQLKKADPDGKIFLTVTDTVTPERLNEIIPYIDVIAPHYYTWRSSTALKQAAAKHKLAIWPYFNVHPCALRDEGYSVYRRMGWNAADYGATGFGTWIYFQPYYHSWKKPDMSLIYVKTSLIDNGLQDAPEKTAPDELIITSKRWEGWREGTEDYFILRMLERKTGKIGCPALKEEAETLIREALNSVTKSNDANLAESYKRKFLRLLVKMDENAR